MNQNTNTSHAALIHLSAGIGGLLNAFIPIMWSLWVPLVLWYLWGSESKFNDWHGREAVRFQLMAMLYSLIFWVAALAGGVSAVASVDVNNMSASFIVAMAIFVIFALVAGFTILVLPFVAAYKAKNGENYVYPFVFSPRRKKRQDATA